MPNPNIAQGNLSRLIASVQWPAFPQLNISPSYLMPEGIDVAFEGQADLALQTMTGIVNSPEPYQMARITLHLIRAQGFADTWKQQLEASVLLGGCTIRPDTTTMSPWTIGSTAIAGIDRMAFAGRDAGFTVNVVGVYSVNSLLWN